MSYSTIAFVSYDSDYNISYFNPSAYPSYFNNYPNFIPSAVNYNNYTDGWLSSVKYDSKNCSGSPSSVTNNYYGNCLVSQSRNNSWSVMKLIDLGERQYYYYYNYYYLIKT